MELEHVLGIQVLFLGSIAAGYNSLTMDIGTFQRYLVLLARFTVYLLASQALELACTTIYTTFHTRQLPELHWRPKYKNTAYAFGVSLAVLVFNNSLTLEFDAVLLLLGCSVARYLEMKRRAATITYGEGMACSFSEGYLYHVIPSDGARFFGLEEQIRAVESRDRSFFPLRRLLIVVTKSLFCPPNLEHYNRGDSFPRLEACLSLGDVQKDVAGVRDRVYRNSTYKIRLSADERRPAHVVAECATPLHTLWRVLQRRAVYQRLADADGGEITREFCATLRRIIDDSPELRGKCDLVFFDDTNPNENLTEVLLAKIRELQPDFETLANE